MYFIFIFVPYVVAFQFSGQFCNVASFHLSTVSLYRRLGQVKRGQCSFFRCSKARFREFW